MNHLETFRNLKSIAEELAQEVKKQQDLLRMQVVKHAPEFLPEYDALMKEVYEGTKSSRDVAEWWQKFHHAFKSKMDNGLNKK